MTLIFILYLLFNWFELVYK